jgi:two-component system, chemotaxis family, chemotaxis protein CheY
MKILVVDDEMDVKMLFEQRFRKEIRDGEMSFAFAFSGEEALDWNCFSKSNKNIFSHLPG